MDGAHTPFPLNAPTTCDDLGLGFHIKNDYLILNKNNLKYIFDFLS